MPAAEFTQSEVLRIRSLFDQGVPAPQIARLFPTVGLETLRRIGRRETYRNVPEAPKQDTLEAEAAASLARLLQPSGGAPEAPDAIEAFVRARQAGEGEAAEAILTRHLSGTPVLGDALLRELQGDGSETSGNV